MFRYLGLRVGWLVFAAMAFAPVASAFVDPPVLVPEHPVAGETVSVSIRIGVCDVFIEQAGYPQISRTDNNIRLVVASLHYKDSAICVYPISTGVFEVGAFPAGTYTLQVDRIYENYFGEDVVETLGVLSFAVTGASPTVVPALASDVTVVLVVSMMLMATIFLRRRAGTLLVALLLLTSLDLGAQSAPDGSAIALLLDEGAGAPTPQTVVTYYATVPRSGKPPLPSLAAGNPETVVYLLPLRAEGDFGWRRKLRR